VKDELKRGLLTIFEACGYLNAFNEVPAKDRKELLDNGIITICNQLKFLIMCKKTETQATLDRLKQRARWLS